MTRGQIEHGLRTYREKSARLAVVVLREQAEQQDERARD